MGTEQNLLGVYQNFHEWEKKRSESLHQISLVTNNMQHVELIS